MHTDIGDRKYKIGSTEGKSVYYDGMMYYMKVNGMNLAVDYNKIKFSNNSSSARGKR